MTTTPIRVCLNGDNREVPAGLNVRGLLESLDLDPEMIVVERNRDILLRDSYADVPVDEGDIFELVHFVGGG